MTTLRRDRLGALAIGVAFGAALATPARLPAQEGQAGQQHPRAAHGDPAEAEAAVRAVLDELHAAASAADYDRYFAVLADDGVFLGTDATERWTVAQFKDYAGERFARGNGWTYTTLERYVTVSEHGHTAWFDERLENARYGQTRGSGVAVHTPEGWKIVQYNLTIPIPNALAEEFVERIREASAGR